MLHLHLSCGELLQREGLESYGKILLKVEHHGVPAELERCL